MAIVYHKDVKRNPGVTITRVSEFESSGENAALKEAIVARIQRDGPITFRDFMEMSLYAPRLGYYTSRREKIGRSGDYVTSPEVSPIFGAMVGRQLQEMWDTMGRPGSFDVVEAGAGTGSLCHDIVRWSRRVDPAFCAALRYMIVEASEALAERQRETIEGEGLSDNVHWLADLPQGVEGCIVSNELLDAMPIHRVAAVDGVLRELYVTWEGGTFREELRAPSTPEIEAYFERLGLLPGDGCLAEVNLQAVRWVKDAAEALGRGFVMTLDYGYEAADLYAPWRTGGTLLCFYRHNPSTDLYSRIGRQDMTSHVDFSSVRRAGEEAGLQTLGLVSQSEFLMNLGLPDALPAIGEGETNLEEYYTRRRAVVELVDPAGLGRIKVLVQAKDAGDAALTGLRQPDGGR
jgi:SAM-dependent MidA family methyltransferase